MAWYFTKSAGSWDQTEEKVVPRICPGDVTSFKFPRGRGGKRIWPSHRATRVKCFASPVPENYTVNLGSFALVAAMMIVRRGAINTHGKTGRIDMY